VSSQAVLGTTAGLRSIVIFVELELDDTQQRSFRGLSRWLLSKEEVYFLLFFRIETNHNISNLLKYNVFTLDTL